MHILKTKKNIKLIQRGSLSHSVAYARILTPKWSSMHLHCIELFVIGTFMKICCPPTGICPGGKTGIPTHGPLCRTRYGFSSHYGLFRRFSRKVLLKYGTVAIRLLSEGNVIVKAVCRIGEHLVGNFRFGNLF